MKAISLWEPWASLIKCKSKTYETRSWKTHHRGKLLICSAKRKRIIELIYHLCCQHFQRGLQPLIGKEYHPGNYASGVEIEDLSFGKALAIVDLVDCIKTENLKLGEIENEKHFGDFTIGRYAWKLEDIEPIETPFPVTGRQGFFNVDVEGKI